MKNTVEPGAKTGGCMSGYVMQLQNFSVNDGQGIRTIVFLAGCPLRCAWCSNPEGQTVQNSMTHFMETDEVITELHRQEIFYRYSGGGVTFSGGEATAQPEFLKELVDRLYDDGFSLALETCGQFSFIQLEPVLKKMDLIFVDIKHIDPQKHERYTGMSNELILSNILRIKELGVPMVIRVPAIVGVNCDDEAMEGLFAFLLDHGLNGPMEFLPYHRLGEAKYHELGLSYCDDAFEIPTDAMLDRWKERAKGLGIQVVSYL